MDPNDVSASNIANPSHADGDVADNDVDDAQEGVNSVQLEDNHT